jgi:hypothetical protein
VIKQFDVQRVSKLVLMLSSQHDGEIVSAARALSRTLKSSGADFHDLIAGLTQPKLQPHASAHAGASGDELKDWREMRKVCLRNPDRLRDRERQFLEGIGNWVGDLTPKQFDWLKSIYQRVKPGQR